MNLMNQSSKLFNLVNKHGMLFNVKYVIQHKFIITVPLDQEVNLPKGGEGKMGSVVLS